MTWMRWHHNDGDMPFVPIRYSLSTYRHPKAHPNYGDKFSVNKRVPLRRQVQEVALVTAEELAKFQRQADERENARWEWDRRFHGIRPGLSEVA